MGQSCCKVNDVDLCTCLKNPVFVTAALQPVQWGINANGVLAKDGRGKTAIFITGYTIAWLCVLLVDLVAWLSGGPMWIYSIVTFVAWVVLVTLGMYTRKRIRGHNKHSCGTCCSDCLAHAFCACCAIIQEAEALPAPNVNRDGYTKV